MCGRYNFSAEESAEIRKIIREVESRQGVTGMKTGEIFPTNMVPILVLDGKGSAPELQAWGFPSFRGKGVIINARAESAAAKPIFRKCLEARRCVVPTTGFYEWDSGKNKRLFRLPDTGALYLAGLYNDFAGERRFVILTTAANESIINVHDRMPVILRGDELTGWMNDAEAAGAILRRVPPMLIEQPA